MLFDLFDIESVIALEPDLVIVGYQSKDTYGKILDREKIPVYYVDAGHVVSYESIKELTDVLIKAFGQHNAGAEAITDRFNKLEARMAEKRQENKGQKVMVLQSAPPRHYIQGKEGTLGSMLDMLGYENVYQNNKMVLIDLEQALSYEPDLLFCVGGSKTAAEHQQVMEEDFAIFLIGIFTFELLRRRYHNKTIIKFAPVIEYISRCSFGIYIIHKPILVVLQKYFNHFTTASVHIQMPALFFASLFGSLILLYPFKSVWKKAGVLLFHIK